MTPPTLESELQNLLNYHSVESGSDTPDFILAAFLLGCLETYNKTLVAREKWYGRLIGFRKPIGIQEPTFATRFKNARGPLSQTQAAELLNRSVHTIRNWEQGRNEPDPETQSLCLSLLTAETNPEY
jgi:DNA-binding XRE family transcriptional regulator